MNARKLNPQELYLSRRNMAVCFEGEFDPAVELEKSKTEEANPKEDHWGVFLGDPQDPAASLVMNKYEARFDGHTVKLGGVGGVATLPGFRRGGAIRACMEAALRDLYHEGALLSALYPFSTGFYGQFGFAPGAVCRRWSLRLRDLPRLPEPAGTVRQLFPGDDLSPLTEIYSAVFEQVNLSMLRKSYAEWMEKENFLGKKRGVFVWFDEQGSPGAFLMYSREKDAMLCWPDFPRKSDGLLFRDARALTALLSFVRTAFIANFETIEFVVPGHIDLTGLLPELSGMDCRAVLNGMVRLIDVERALRLCRCKGEGELTLEVSDGMIPENEGVFRLRFAPGEENRVERTAGDADISLRVGTLSQLLCGVKGAEDLPFLPAAEVRRPGAPFDRVFYRKPCQMLDLF